MSADHATDRACAGTAGHASTRRGPRAAAPGDTVRNLRTALLLGWRMESNWTDPLLFFIYSVAKPIASLLLLVAMVTIIGGSGDQRGPDVRGPRQRAVGDARRGDRRARPGRSSTTASATGCSSTCT